MPNFLETIFAQLQRSAGRVVLREIHGEQFVSVTGKELLEQVRQVRAYLRGAALQPGDRCALLAPNSIGWAAFDLALMAEGVIVVPLYNRQSPAELAAMMKDSQPKLLLVSDTALADAATQAWTGDTSDAPRRVLFDEVLRQPVPPQPISDTRNLRKTDDIVTIIYTSGTSGEPKGVCLTAANLSHMLSCTNERLDQLMGQTREPDRVFHYAPFNFAASWILLLSCLSVESVLTLSTDLARLPDEIRLSAPHYILNVPTLLARVSRALEDALSKRSAPIRLLFASARGAWQRRNSGRAKPFDPFWLALGRKLIFSKIKGRFGPHLRALICGSAQLAPETQQFFLMLGIPVLQAYGLTETTAICTLDNPRLTALPGYVGHAIHCIATTHADHDEII